MIKANAHKTTNEKVQHQTKTYHGLGDVLAVDELLDSGEIHHRLHLLSGHGVHKPLRDGPDRVEQNVRGIDHRALEGLGEQVLHQTENSFKIVKATLSLKNKV